jgi:cell division protein FtsB
MTQEEGLMMAQTLAKLTDAVVRLDEEVKVLKNQIELLKNEASEHQRAPISYAHPSNNNW